jgi:hypothetical protein
MHITTCPVGLFYSRGTDCTENIHSCSSSVVMGIFIAVEASLQWPSLLTSCHSIQNFGNLNSGTIISPTAQVHTTAMLLLLTEGKQRVWCLCGLQWYNIHTIFYEINQLVQKLKWRDIQTTWWSHELTLFILNIKHRLKPSIFSFNKSHLLHFFNKLYAPTCIKDKIILMPKHHTLEKHSYRQRGKIPHILDLGITGMCQLLAFRKLPPPPPPPSTHWMDVTAAFNKAGKEEICLCQNAHPCHLATAWAS